MLCDRFVPGITREGVHGQMFEVAYKMEELELSEIWEPEWLHGISLGPSFTRKANLC